ncbi:hypothetical protein GT347_02350 [Xylophilus rhododendri]|uniref:Uncharacterized protein n=1 Tax=Xylophilus rhododendri TaxID=2697032 RepID=A0A857J178_9BURK|nr:hypothetical protein [Xylophilus rhododendri]QHI96929.1 hypothetical protein GT347_02350 [Xylophilus rhododendri]
MGFDTTSFVGGSMPAASNISALAAVAQGAAAHFLNKSKSTELKASHTSFSKSELSPQEISHDLQELLGLPTPATPENPQAVFHGAFSASKMPATLNTSPNESIKPASIPARHSIGKRAASTTLQQRLKIAIPVTIASFRHTMGLPNSIIHPNNNLLQVTSILNGRRIGLAIRPLLTHIEMQTLQSQTTSAFQNSLEAWVEYLAYRMAAINQRFEDNQEEILKWVREETAQVISQADNFIREEKIRTAYLAGKNSLLFGNSDPAQLHPAYAYATMQDMNNYAPCDFIAFVWYKKNDKQYGTMLARTLHECSGNTETHHAYSVGRQQKNLGQEAVFSSDYLNDIPRGERLRLEGNLDARNCGPGNFLYKQVPTFNWFKTTVPPLCPPYVSPHTRRRTELIAQLDQDFDNASNKRSLDPRILSTMTLGVPAQTEPNQQVFGPLQRPFIDQPSFDKQRQQFDGQAINQPGGHGRNG